MLPATKAIPKEMLPLVDKPLIQYVVNECIAAGITEIVLVTHSSKNSIENHFDTSFELEAMLENALSVSFWRRFSLFALRMSLLCRYVKGWQKAWAMPYCARIPLSETNLSLLFCQTLFLTNMSPTCLRITWLK